MKISHFYFTIILLMMLQSCKKEEQVYQLKSEVPDLQMPNNHLNFKEIEDYKNYKIITTHYRTDKKELRYILANKKAFESYKNGGGFLEGSILVKIGWNTTEMANFSPAIVAKKVQRIEYMIKDAKRFSKNPGNWGYARFVKQNDTYKPWKKGTESCVACHQLAKQNEYVFSEWQLLD